MALSIRMNHRVGRGLIDHLVQPLVRMKWREKTFVQWLKLEHEHGCPYITGYRINSLPLLPSSCPSTKLCHWLLHFCSCTSVHCTSVHKCAFPQCSNYTCLKSMPNKKPQLPVNLCEEFLSYTRISPSRPPSEGNSKAWPHAWETWCESLSLDTTTENMSTLKNQVFLVIPSDLQALVSIDYLYLHSQTAATQTI